MQIVDERLSRWKAKENVGGSTPYPSNEAIASLYLLHRKIGADNELPSDKQERDSWLADMWFNLFYNNNFCPGDIPFPIILKEFQTGLIQGRISRKGNNQGAICEAFNNWITQQKVRNRLYMLRDQAYPQNKPKQVTERATEPTLADFSLDELKAKRKIIGNMAGIKTVDAMIEELDEEIARRG